MQRKVLSKCAIAQGVYNCYRPNDQNILRLFVFTYAGLCIYYKRKNKTSGAYFKKANYFNASVLWIP